MSMGNLKKDRKRVETSYGIRVIPVPFLENPFQVSSHDFGFFEQIWKGKQVITLNLSTDNQLVIEFRPEVYESLIVTF